jgi:hypothetical protein
MLKLGETVAKKWTVHAKIGEGTFSEIYSAKAVRKGDPAVAIKISKPGFDAAQVRRCPDNTPPSSALGARSPRSPLSCRRSRT